MKVFSSFSNRPRRKSNVTVRRKPAGKTLAVRTAGAKTPAGKRPAARKAGRGGKSLFTALTMPAADLQAAFLKLALGVGALALLLIVAIILTELRGFYRSASHWQVTQLAFSGQQRLGEPLLRDTYEHYLATKNLGRTPRAFDLDLAELRLFFLAQVSGLADVTVTRVLPDGLQFAVVEREPVALVRLGGQVAYQIDRQGVLFTLANPGDCRYPVLTGLDASQLVVGQANTQPAVATALQLLAAIDPAWYPRIAEINTSDPQDVVAWVDGHKVLLGDEGYREKFTTLHDLLPQLAGRRVEYINVRSALRPAVKPLGAGGAADGQQPAAASGR